MIDWQSIPKIDAHIHLAPEDVICANRGNGDPFVEHGSVYDYAAIMDRYHIEAAFVMPFNDPYRLSMDFKIQTVHSNLRKIAAALPARLRCFADVDIRNDIDATLKELDDALAGDAFVGIKLHPSNAGYPIDGNYYDRILEYAAGRNALVEIHSYPRAHLSDDVCAPRRIKNVLKKYPKLRLSIAHLGGMQFEEFYGMNAYFNFSAVLPDIIRRFGMGRANEILRSIGVDRLIFATDYPDSRCLKPNEIYESYFEMLGGMDFSREEAENICRNNALKMLGAK